MKKDLQKEINLIVNYYTTNDKKEALRACLNTLVKKIKNNGRY